jgi:mannose-1-phosphate guanylyltransferase
MFCMAAGAVVREMTQHCPEILSAVKQCLEKSRVATGDGFTQVELDPDTFAGVPDISIDYALMEKSRNVAIVPCDIGWSDIGSWNAIGDLAPSDDHGNQVEGRAFLHDVSGCYIRSERVVGAVGVANLLVIDTADALLVADKSRAQDVRHVYAQLKELGHEAHKAHRTVHRPWGTYTVLEEGPGFKIKRIEVKPGASLSLQMHHHRSEHWIVVSGTAKVVNGEREMSIQTNESTFIPARNKHRLGNPTAAELVIIEVQSGDYLGEDDIVRFDDEYGRATKISAR